MYNAHGLNTDDHQGSTRLHLDVSSAVNIMLYAAKPADGWMGGALWHIFPSAALPILRDFLRSECPTIDTRDSGDPIHNQMIYLTPALLQLLAEKHDIHPFTIHQSPGDAVFIPAGCAHQVRCRNILDHTHLTITNLQVSNISDLIKIACDFLDSEGLAASSRLRHELRKQRLSHHWPEDVLQFEVTLWHAWTSLLKQKAQLTAMLLSAKPMPMLGPTTADSVMCVGANTNGVVLSKQERKQEKRRLFRRRVADVQRSHMKPGHNCQCLLCPQPRYFNKRGLFHHL
jgi:hypothetical protein